MQPQTTKTLGPASGEESATVARSRWNWSQPRTITYWTFTVLLVFELVAGSVWNLMQIEWVHIQLNHLGYPLYFSRILGVWQIGGAAVIIAPRFPRIKEWAYAGAFFEFSGAVASHLLGIVVKCGRRTVGRTYGLHSSQAVVDVKMTEIRSNITCADFCCHGQAKTRCAEIWRDVPVDRSDRR